MAAGTTGIAGIGFASSYAAVRELAIKKGFGNFAYVFPIGIDAGICVLLALDLLLTWIRIPFPLLRQTAWLLTVATIAFNGAAAWPDPLGVGMHAVIPILFVVAVEAARHAIGRIADITADKHMEGVRLTRWLLSPVPTFLLWRRMKLWELRSYDQVIKLEQERLVYQARLRSRFGRAWRRKAPVEFLMPLRLAKYGVPLADTAPDGQAAVGVHADINRPAQGRATAPVTQPHKTLATYTEHQEPPRLLPPAPPGQAPNADSSWTFTTTRHDTTPASHRPDISQTAMSWDQAGSVQTVLRHKEAHGLDAPAHRVLSRRLGKQPNSGVPSATLPITVKAGGDSLAPDLSPRSDRSSDSTRTRVGNHGTKQPDHDRPPGTARPHAPAPAARPHAEEQHAIDVAPTASAQNEERSTPRAGGPTLVDRYYQAWAEHRTQYGREPTADELSVRLADKGMLGRANKSLNPSTLRRYTLAFRIYTIWAEHRVHTPTPSPDTVAHDCTQRGVTAQYNKPVSAAHITTHSHDFERRWNTLTTPTTPTT
ncbi:DUF2637 domain-containing protein [Streptomyces sp.]|uniref:DUF2637 domain-containing protein n=1 Tax=Streptomyces sp. TaxID=1931 RepID=UPI0025CD4CB1|nr:DUF2637 domain-containing protein [Streptomyces sp.]